MIVAASPVTASDEIRLKNGSILQGKIVREDKDVIVIDLGRGRMSIQRRDVVAVKKQTEPEEPATPDQRGRPTPDNSEDAVPAPQRNPPPRVVPAQVPRKKKGGAAGPKVLPVGKPPAQAPAPGAPAPRAKDPGPEGPAKKPVDRAGTASRPTRPTAKPDW
jgi:hypothetical protein